MSFYLKSCHCKTLFLEFMPAEMMLLCAVCSMLVYACVCKDDKLSALVQDQNTQLHLAPIKMHFSVSAACLPAVFDLTVCLH